MTNITVVKSNGGTYGIQISGHAGFSDIGTDIVCAGVSAITYALAEYLQQNDGGKIHITEMKMEPGDVRIACRGDADDVFRMATLGWAMIGKQYPANVLVEIRWAGDAISC